MCEDSPSRTAAGVAYRRAAHQVLDRPLVFSDPLARLVLSSEAQAGLDADPYAPELQGDIPNYTDVAPVIQINEVLISKRAGAQGGFSIARARGAVEAPAL